MLKIQAAANVFACVHNQMEMNTTAFHALVYADIMFEMFFKKVCAQAVKAAACLFDVLYVVGKCKGKESNLFNSENFDELAYIHLKGGGGFLV